MKREEVRMKKVGILTLFYKTYNFGAQLQAYALQKAVEWLGIPCEQIRFVWSKEDTRGYYENVTVDQPAFEEFAARIPHSKRIYTPADLSEAEKEYDSFLCGSDQIWGVKDSMPEHVLPQMALSFVGKNKKKIAYGASFGSADIEENRKQVLKRFLNRLDHISVRERSAIPVVEEMSKKPVTSVVDPVFMLSAEQWRLAASYGNGRYSDEAYVLLYSVSGSAVLHEQAKEFAEERGMSLVYIAYIGGVRVGPSDFLALIDRAAYVITDSFHGTAFSIIFQRPFITMGVDSLPERFSKNARVKDMLKSFGLEAHFFQRADEAWKTALTVPDYSKEIIEHSIDYLRYSLMKEGNLPKRFKNFQELRETVIDQGKCTGCSACTRCSLSCIRMAADELGFYHPVFDERSCTDCGQCLDLCPAYPGQKSRSAPAVSVLAVQAKDEKILAQSASGGAFFVIAEKWIDDGGVVCGAVYDDLNDFAVKHICTDTKDGLLAMQKSKYVQSEVGTCFAEVEQYLEQGRRVLFSGTPCQAVGLTAYLRKDYGRLYIIDLVCGGVTAPLLWKKYVDFYQRDEALEAFDMRAKAKGFFDVNGRLAFTMSHLRNGKKLIFDKDKDLFLRPRMSFYGESCYQCQFKGDCHDADLTLGDFVGLPKIFPGKCEEKGISLVIVRSEKGKELMESCQSAYESFHATYEEAASWNEMLDFSMKKPLGIDYLRGIAPVSSIERIYYEGERIQSIQEREDFLRTFCLELKRNDLLFRVKKYTHFQCFLEHDPSIVGRIVIYGAGKLGRALLDCMEGEPLCFLDRAKSLKNVCGCPVYRIGEEEFGKIVAKIAVTVIITPVWDYWEIREDLKEIYPEMHIVSLEKLMERIGTWEN